MTFANFTNSLHFFLHIENLHATSTKKSINLEQYFIFMMCWFSYKKSKMKIVSVFLLIGIMFFSLGVKSQSIQGKWVGYHIEKNVSNLIMLPKTTAYQIYIRTENNTLYGVAYRGDANNVLSKIFVTGKYDSMSHVVTLNEFRILENPLSNNCLFNMTLKVENDCLKGIYFTMVPNLKNNTCSEGYIYLEREKTYQLSDNLFAKILQTPSNTDIAKKKEKKSKTENPQVALTYFEAKSNVFMTTSIDAQNAYNLLHRRPLFNVSNIDIRDSLIHITLQSPKNTDTFSIFQGDIMIVPKIIFSQPFNMWITLNSTFATDNITLVNLSKKSPNTLPVEIELTIGREKKIIPILVDTNNVYKLNFSLIKKP